MDSMADYLALALNRASLDLISQDAIADLNVLGKKLPPGFGNFLFGFECRLGEDDPSVDIAMSLVKGNIFQNMVEEILDHHLFKAHARSNPAWKKLKILINSYLGSDPLLSKCLESISLEFDRETAVDNHPVPGVFLGLRPYSRLTGNGLKENATKSITPSVAYRAMVKGLGIIGGNEITGEIRKTLRSLYRQLTPPADIFQAGAMLSRNTSAAKICIRCIDGTQIISFLKSTGWKGDYKTLESVIK